MSNTLNTEKPYKVFTPLGWVEYRERWIAQQTADLYGGRVYRNNIDE